MPTCSRQTLVKGHAFLVKTGVLPQVALWGKGILCLRRFCYARNMYNKMNFCRFTSKFPRNPIGCGFEVHVHMNTFKRGRPGYYKRWKGGKMKVDAVSQCPSRRMDMQ